MSSIERGLPPDEYHFVSPGSGRSYVLRRDPCHGFLRTDPWPSQEELVAVYQNFENTTPLFNEFRFISLLSRRLKLVQRSWHICEVGCGTGGLLDEFRSAGHKVMGFEPSKKDQIACLDRGLDVVNGFYSPEIMAARPPQDIFILINVVEHVPDPESVLRDMRKFLNPETGYLLILVPNEFSPLQALILNQRRRSAQDAPPYFIGPPIHLSYFSPSSLRSLVEAAGYEIVHTTADFPMELFVLMGRNYLENPELGRQCHRERVALETALHENPDLFWRFYDALASADMGREIILVAKVKP